MRGTTRRYVLIGIVERVSNCSGVGGQTQQAMGRALS
jgi:hypothetical protein